jgi:hypothetical protein
MFAANAICWFFDKSLWVLLRSYWQLSKLSFRIYCALLPGQRPCGEWDSEDSMYVAVSGEVPFPNLCRERITRLSSWVQDKHVIQRKGQRAGEESKHTEDILLPSTTFDAS